MQAAPRPEQSFKDLFDTLAAQIERVLRGKRRAVHLVARVSVLRGSSPHRGRARRRQDVAREGDRPFDRRLVAARAVHARPAAVRHHRRLGLGPRPRRLRVPARRRVRQRRARRRDQPRVAEDAVGAPRVDGGTPGQRRRADVQAAAPVHGDRDPEPRRARRHVSPARSAARPLPVALAHRLSRPRRGDRDPRRRGRRPDRTRRSRTRHRRGDRRRVDPRARTHSRLARAAGLHRRPRRGDPPSPRPHARREPARRARVAARGARARGEHRPRVRRGRRREGARVVGARAPAAAVVRGDDAGRQPGRRPGGDPRQRARSRDTAPAEAAEPRC